MELRVEGANSFEGSPQLAQWKAILLGLDKHNFEIGSTTEIQTQYGYKYLQTVLQHSTGTYTLKTACIGWDSLGIAAMRLDLRKPLSVDHDFTYLPHSPRPRGITLAFPQKDYKEEKARQIREQLIQFGQKEVEVAQIALHSTKIDRYDLDRGSLRINYDFVPPSNRRNCSFEMDATGPVRQMFEQGLFPYHVDQTKGNDKHYCITAPKVPLIPVALDERVSELRLFYNNLNQLPRETFDELFKGISLPALFSISYDGDPHVSIYANYGGRVLGMDVLDLGRHSGNSYLDPEKTANSIANNMYLFNQFYSNFQSFQQQAA